MQIKTVEVLSHPCQNSYHKKISKKLARMWEKETFAYYWWEFKLVHPLWKLV
jgi:hypothetical protein